MTLDKEMLEANLIKLLGLELLPLEEKTKILQQTSELVQKRLMVRLLQELTEKEQEEFLNLVNANGQDGKKEQFMSQHFPQINQMMDEEINKVKEELKIVTEE